MNRTWLLPLKSSRTCTLNRHISMSIIIKHNKCYYRGPCEERGPQSWHSDLRESEKISLRSWHFSWVLKMSRQVTIIIIHFPFELFFLLIYNSWDVWIFYAIATEFRFFYVFLLFSPVSHIWDRLLGISVIVIICKMRTNATCLIELFWGFKETMCLNTEHWSCVWVRIVFGYRS